MDELEQISNAYAEFEAQVRRYSSGLWFRWCSTCREVCCQSLYCRESFESPFLLLLSINHCPEVLNGTQHGWLSEYGCKLPVGRPPVCYEFLCSTILEAQPTAIRRYAMIVLSKLIAHVGKRAFGSMHLVEIMNPADLNKVRYSRFEKRLAEARKAFDVLQWYFNGHKLENDDSKILSKISRR